ncbi:MAG: flagellar basal body rod C-terminal domain-containing protein [Desulfohalobiaceae bacterium]
MDSISDMGAFQSFGLRQQVSANNVANMNTQDFQPSRVSLEEVGNRQGVAPQTVEKTGSLQQAGAEDNGDVVQIEAGQENSEGSPSGTDLSSEMVDMMQNQTAYSANASTVSTQSEMQGQLMDRLA